MLDYDSLTSTANDNEAQNVKPGHSAFYDTSTFIYILIGAIVIINLLFIFVKFLGKKD